MTEVVYSQPDNAQPVSVELRNPGVAALLAWLLPGAGHFYQGRFPKGFLFMICVISTFMYGLGLGRGRVVYASTREGDFRWQYAFQAGAGLMALPALVQAAKAKNDATPFFVLCERYPANYPIEAKRFHRIDPADDYSGPTLKDGFMAPPAGPRLQNDADVLGMWHRDYKHNYEMGTLYTVIAGLLNLLAVYDAFVGPAILTPAQREKLKSKSRNRE